MMQRYCWLIYDKGQAEHNHEYIEKYIMSAKRRNIRLDLILTDEFRMGIREGKPCIWNQNRNTPLPDFVINRTSKPFLSHHFEAMSLPVFNSAHISDICLDKRKSYHAASKASLPVMPTIFCDGELPRWNEIRHEFNGQAMVIKPVDGRSGNNVSLVRSADEYENSVKVFAPGQKIMIQQAASDLGMDLRVYVIGRHIEAAMLRKSDPDRDFRSNYSLGGEASVYSLSHHEKSMIMRLVDRFEFGLVGIDFIFDRGQLVFNEIEDAVGARMLYTKTEIDIADCYLDHIIKQVERGWLPGS